MRHLLWSAAAIGCFALAGLSGCGPAIEGEKTGSPQSDEAAKQHMEQQYQKQAEEMQKMQQEMQKKRR